MSLNRFAVAEALREYLEPLLEGQVTLGTDSSFDPDTLCTRVSVPSFSHVTSLSHNRRWVFNVTVTINVTGSTETEVIEEVDRAHQALLSMIRITGGTTHNIQTQLEPDLSGTTTPGGVPIASTVITFIMREET